MDNIDQLILECTIDELSILNEIDYYTEGKTYNILDSILEFLQKVQNNIMIFAEKLKNDIESIIQKKQVHGKLKKLKKELLAEKKLGTNRVTMIDVKGFNKYFSSYKNKIMKKMNVLSKGNFKTKEKLESIVEDIEKDIDEMNDVLQNTLDHRIEIGIREAIVYVEQNMSGKSTAEKDFISFTHQLKDMELSIKRARKNVSLTNNKEVETSYVGNIKRLTTKISKAFSRWYQKFIMAVVFFFA